MTWGKEAAEAQEAIATQQLRDLQNGVVPDDWVVLGGLISQLSKRSYHGAASILDVGCGVGGTGQFLKRLAATPIRYYGVDINQAAIEYAKKRGMEVACHSIFDFTAHWQVFDILLSNGTVNHLEDWSKALEIMARLSTHWIILHRLWVFHDDTPTEAKLKQAYGQDVWHLRINEAEMVGLLDGLGFELLEKTSSDGSDDPMAGWTYVFERKHDN